MIDMTPMKYNHIDKYIPLIKIYKESKKPFKKRNQTMNLNEKVLIKYILN